MPKHKILQVEDGRVTFSGDAEAVAYANLFLRTADRILLKVGRFEARTFEELFERTKDLPWERYIPKNGKFWVAKANSIRSKLFSPSDIQSIMKKAMVERLKSRYHLEWFPEDGEAFPIRVSIVKDQVLVGLESRIEALKQFFEYVLTLSPKPDLYIKEVLYASWCPRHLDWFSLYHDYALRYMDAGGVIYYFSNLNNLDRSTFYSIWKFTSHKNLYPGYSANMAEESPECAYYLAEGARSVTFYAPEDHPKSYITAICSDPLMLSAQEHYLKKKYEQRQHQIFINTIENRNLVLNIV